jgi:CRISPR-associated protein Cas2
MSQFWMVAYDINDDRIRCEVSNILKDHGERVQYSVFECRLEEKQYDALRIQLAELLGRDDSLRWYPLCKWCRDKVFCQGEGKPPDDEGFVIA